MLARRHMDVIRIRLAPARAASETLPNMPR
jgi:hypothetical protein